MDLDNMKSSRTTEHSINPIQVTYSDLFDCLDLLDLFGVMRRQHHLGEGNAICSALSQLSNKPRLIIN